MIDLFFNISMSKIVLLLFNNSYINIFFIISKCLGGKRKTVKNPDKDEVFRPYVVIESDKGQ